MSVKEEEEQDVINKSIIVDFDRRITTELLPLMFNPLHKLAHNKNNTPRICNQKLNKLNQKPHDKEDVIQSEDKFESLGHMEFVRNLTPEQQKKCCQRIQFRTSSLAEQLGMATLYAHLAVLYLMRLNQLLMVHLAKGKNNMNKLVETMIYWSVNIIGFNTYIKRCTKLFSYNKNIGAFRGIYSKMSLQKKDT